MDALKRLRRAVANMITRGVALAIKDEVARQVIQVRTVYGDVLDDVPRMQQYGFSSVPPENCDVLIAELNGNSSHRVVLCAEDKDVRLKGGKRGDSALYHLEGHYFRLTENGVLEAIGDELTVTVKRIKLVATEEVIVDTPKATFTQDVEIGKNLLVKGKVEGEKGGKFGDVDVVTHDHDYTDNGAILQTKRPNGVSE
ncbi:phage baseplate assembly protein V [Vibrio scophthalmi]|uniref:phage baseplate assembly protein V n=1 Tax=Vibrio scophthalmi TaxID=45658 RepID=UPI003AAAB4AD